jgi:hypothetical protein
VVRAAYPGANARVLAETVAAPLEQEINGVENSLYLASQGTSDGVMTLTVTFKLGTDIDKAQVQVQNRVSQALTKLPEEVRRLGVTTTKQSPDLSMVVHLFSTDGRYDDIYVRNFAVLQVKDVLARVPGAGQVQVFGSGDYAMRIWLDPDKIAAKGLTAGDVVAAIREQNVQVAAGGVGQQPVASDVPVELQVNVKGRLINEEEFGSIIIKTTPAGEKAYLRDVARIELGAAQYALRSLLNNKPAVALPIFQLPGSNAIELSHDVRKAMAELKKGFPEGIDYSIVYDPTVFVQDSINAVVHTLFEAIILVVIVVLIFLQTWRASIIPLAAVPVSLIGTFAVMLALGFSINALSLFGLVLAIGIVVDDAIVVVENVERNIASGLSPYEATRKAMSELRLEMGNRLGLRNHDDYKPLWVIDFPLFEYDEEDNRWVARHHPFTSPKPEQIEWMNDLSKYGDIKANAYDIVLNGTEIGGGSIRIYQRDLQEKMFAALGMSQEEAQEKLKLEANSPVHFRDRKPKNPYCQECQQAKMYHRPHGRKKHIRPLPKHFGDQRTVENLVANFEKSQSLTGDDDVAIVYDHATR